MLQLFSVFRPLISFNAAFIVYCDEVVLIQDKPLDDFISRVKEFLVQLHLRLILYRADKLPRILFPNQQNIPI